jgi:quinoprotein dehydrogenase-associated probable ABC transporter substrate-binding protein
MKPFLRRLAVVSGFALPAFMLAAASPHAEQGAARASADVLRVCADPDYMPFSSRAGQGFENKIAELLAKALGRKLEYRWASYRQQGGFPNFLALNLDAGLCDLVIDLPYGDIEEGYTRPYYISSYVFITKKGEPEIRSMRSPALRTMKIGFEADTAPEIALKITGLTDNAVPFHVADNPSLSPRSMLQAVEDGKIGVMITWAPAIGYFLREYPDLQVTRVPNEEQGPGLPALRFTFAMAMGVRQHDTALKKALDEVIEKDKPQLDAILANYGIKLYSSLEGG